MTVFEQTLLNEYYRSLNLIKSMESSLSNLPKGSLQRKLISGKEYWYLMYREGDKVRSTYVPEKQVDELSGKLKLRKDQIVKIREEKKTAKQIEKALGRDFIKRNLPEEDIQ